MVIKCYYSEVFLSYLLYVLPPYFYKILRPCSFKTDDEAQQAEDSQLNVADFIEK